MKKPLKILAVNDFKVFFELLEFLIKERSLSISFDKAFDGKEAVEKVKAGNIYDAILMNLEMPFMHGTVAAQEIRKLGIKTPIIAWSHHPKTLWEKRCRDSGMDDYIQINVKRFIEDILGALERVVVNETML